MTAVAGQEGLQLEANAAEMLAETSGNDIRQALNALQMWCATLPCPCPCPCPTGGV